MITAKGNDVKTNIKKGDITVKDEYITLKADEGVKVRLLGTDDFVEYNSHGAYGLDIFTQPCGEKGCVYCKAGSAGLEEFNQLKTKARYLFAFAELETGKVKLLDVSKNQAKKLMSGIDEYAEDIADIAFTLKRVGAGKDTAYNLNPILKMKGNDQENFDKFDGESVELQFFIDRLEVRVCNEEFKIKMLVQAGFPVEESKDLFGAELVERALAENTESEVAPVGTETSESLI